MLGFGPVAASPLGAVPVELSRERTALIALSISNVLIFEKPVQSGILINSTAALWDEIARILGKGWTVAFQIPPAKWEEIIAGAFRKADYDEVILTPRSGDHGRDVIAKKHGIGCVKVIGSVKAYAPGRIVPYDDIRALLGVISGEQDASKGIITTTSEFPPKVDSDPYIAPFLPTRLELTDGQRLQQWLTDLLRVE